MRGMCTEKNGALTQLGAEKITFPPKHSWQADGHTNGIYRVASLLKNTNNYLL